MLYLIEPSFCNLNSIKGSLQRLRMHHEALTPTSNLTTDDIILFPGVGTFGQAVDWLHESELFDILTSHLHLNGNYIGICLGMQILFEQSEESPEKKGLGIIGGTVRLLDNSHCQHIPHIGWDQMMINHESCLVQPLEEQLKHLLEEHDYYFVHSYFCSLENKLDELTHVEGIHKNFTSMIKQKKIIGMQFHPEKS